MEFGKNCFISNLDTVSVFAFETARFAEICRGYVKDIGMKKVVERACAIAYAERTKLALFGTKSPDIGFS